MTQIYRKSYYRNLSKIKKSSLKKFVADKKALITITFGQCDKATKTKIALRANYKANHQAGRLIGFLNRLHTVWFGSNDSGLSYGPYKQVAVVKLTKNYSNNKPYDPRGFKEEVKISIIPKRQ